MDTQTYFRKAFSVEAVQVTAENINEIAEWSAGLLKEDQNGQYVHIQVHKPMSVRQTRGYVGDWVLKSNRGFKVYTNVAFLNGFLKDEDGKISTGWENITNVFDNAMTHLRGEVSEKDAIAGKR